MSKLVITVASNPTATAYLKRSVEDGIPLASIAAHSEATPALDALREHSPDGLVRMWGSVPGSEGRHFATWDRIEPGDWLAFSIDGRFRRAGRIYSRLDSSAIADAVWPPDAEAGSYRYLTFFDALTSIDVSPRAMSEALGYGASYIYRGFLVPSEPAQEHLLSTYGTVAEFLGTLAAEKTAFDSLARVSFGSGYVGDLSAFDTAEAEARLEDTLRDHLKTEPPEIVEARVRRIKRDRRLVKKLKALYEGRCQRCEFTFAKEDGAPYSEAAHINRIANLLAGIDSPDNIVILCANCHRMLDYGTLEIRWDENANEAVGVLDGVVTTLSINKHIRLAWAPAQEWLNAAENDLEW